MIKLWYLKILGSEYMEAYYIPLSFLLCIWIIKENPNAFELKKSLRPLISFLYCIIYLLGV